MLHSGTRSIIQRFILPHIGRSSDGLDALYLFNGVTGAGSRSNCSQAVNASKAFLFFWSQRGDLNSGPTDYELFSGPLESII